MTDTAALEAAVAELRGQVAELRAAGGALQAADFAAGPIDIITNEGAVVNNTFIQELIEAEEAGEMGEGDYFLVVEGGKIKRVKKAAAGGGVPAATNKGQLLESYESAPGVFSWRPFEHPAAGTRFLKQSGAGGLVWGAGLSAVTAHAVNMGLVETEFEGEKEQSKKIVVKHELGGKPAGAIATSSNDAFIAQISRGNENIEINAASKTAAEKPLKGTIVIVSWFAWL